jgi:hypothetical protein
LMKSNAPGATWAQIKTILMETGTDMCTSMGADTHWRCTQQECGGWWWWSYCNAPYNHNCAAYGHICPASCNTPGPGCWGNKVGAGSKMVNAKEALSRVMSQYGQVAELCPPLSTSTSTIWPNGQSDTCPPYPYYIEDGYCDEPEGWNLCPEGTDCTDCGGCPPACDDEHRSCSYWAGIGECSRNPGYMLWKCKPSCGACPVPVEELKCGDYAGRCNMDYNKDASKCQMSPGSTTGTCVEAIAGGHQHDGRYDQVPMGCTGR